MSAETIIQVILFGFALSADAFSVAVTMGLTVPDLNKKRTFFIAFIFGLFQGLFPLAGYWLIEGIAAIVGASGGEKAGAIMATAVSWIAFGLLLFIGGKMILEAIKEIRHPEEKECKHYSNKTVLVMGVATAIDALAVGVAFHETNASGISMSNNATIWLHVSIILAITFVLSLVGLLFGNFFRKLFRNKIEITEIIGGCILIALAIWVILSHYFGI